MQESARDDGSTAEGPSLEIAPFDVRTTARDLTGHTVGVVGAGLSGLVAAQTLTARGARVVVFDKGQVPGGRMSQRSDRGHRFDHGAQYFTMRSAAMRGAVDDWVARGIVRAWSPRGGAGRSMLVAAPGMNAIALHLASLCDVRRGVRVSRVVREGGSLRLDDDEGVARASVDAVVVAVPAPQAPALLFEAPALAERARAATLSPCWALMVAFDRPLPAPIDVARFEEGPLSWIARDSAKPGRDPSNGEAWVAHASTAWSVAHLEDDAPTAAAALLDAFRARLDVGPAAIRMAHAHRWRFARTERALGEACLLDATRRIAVCGDWCLGARVECAYVSGLAAGRAIDAGALNR